MIALLALWGRRLWPYLTLALICGAVGALGAYLASVAGAERALAAAHARTIVVAAAAAHQDTVFRTDTVERRVLVKEAQAARTVALQHLTDTLLVKAAFRKDSSAEASSDSTISQAARTIQAHIIVESALRTELAVCMRLRAPRFTLSSQAGVDVDAVTPVTGLEASVRVAEHWSIVGRLDKRWAPGEGTRRQLLLRYSIGR